MENPETGCLEWQKARDVHGYGRIGGQGKTVLYAHRVAWEMENGPIPGGMYVCHRCDNPACIRPEHLFLGTQLDNIRDMVAKGRTGTTKLTDLQVQEIRDRYVRDAHPWGKGTRSNARELGSEFGVTPECIYMLVGNKYRKGVA